MLVGSVKYLYTRDHLGSIREMTDNSGTLKARYEYDPYGRRGANQVTGGAVEADFGFTGHYYHAPSGLHLALYLAYDADAGRWLNRDPIGEFGGLNLYGYVGNDSINDLDPLGLIDCATLASMITHMENNIHGAIRSMSDISQMFDSAENMQITSLGGEFAYAIMSGGSAAAELSEFNAVRFSRPVYKLGGVTSAIVFNEGIYAGLIDLPNTALFKATGLNIVNPAEAVAEQENEMGQSMSASTYETIKGLQSQLAGMLNLYDSNCKCRK